MNIIDHTEKRVFSVVGSINSAVIYRFSQPEIEVVETVYLASGAVAHYTATLREHDPAISTEQFVSVCESAASAIAHVEQQCQTVVDREQAGP